MNTRVAISLLAAAVTAAACVSTESPTSPTGAIRRAAGQGASLAKTESTCPKPAPRPSRPVELRSLPLDPPQVSTVGSIQVNVLFTNATCEVLHMVWVRPNGEQITYETLQPGGTNEQNTYVGHLWLIKRADETTYAMFRIEDYPSGAQEVFLGCTKGKNAFCN